jgi:hypothetical protein
MLSKEASRFRAAAELGRETSVPTYSPTLGNSNHGSIRYEHCGQGTTSGAQLGVAPKSLQIRKMDWCIDRDTIVLDQKEETARVHVLHCRECEKQLEKGKLTRFWYENMPVKARKSLDKGKTATRIPDTSR